MAESPLDRKEIKPVNPIGNRTWICIGKTDAETPIFWPLDAQNWLIGKDLDALKIEDKIERLKTKGKGGSRGWDG